MKEKKKDPRWLSALQGVVLWAVAGFLGWSLWSIRSVILGLVLTQIQVGAIETCKVVTGIAMVVVFFLGLYQLCMALREDNDV